MPSTRGWRRSTTWSSPTAAARSGSATPAGCRCAPRRTGAASCPGRGADTWSGWVELPRHDVPPDGQVVTANERRGSESELLGSEFAPPHRAARIHALLRGRDDLTVRGLRGHPRRLVRDHRAPAVRDGPGPGARAGGGAGPRRDPGVGRRDGGRAPAAPRRSRPGGARSPRGCAPSRSSRRCATYSVYGPLFAPYLSLEASVGWALEPLADARTPFGIDVRRLATEALEDAAGHPDAWGDTHVFAPTHAFDLADAGPRAARAADHAGVRRHRHGPLHRVAARAHRRGLPRLGRPLRVGPRRPRAERLGGADGRLGRPAVVAPPRPAGGLGRGPAAAGRAGLGAAHAGRRAGPEQSFSNHACA